MRYLNFVLLLLLVAVVGCGNAEPFKGIVWEDYSRALFVGTTPPMIQQSEEIQCGLASALWVLSYYGVEPSKIADSPIIENFGGRPLTAYELVSIAEEVGLVAYAYVGDLDDLESNVVKGRPVITLLDRPPRTAQIGTWDWAMETAEKPIIVSHWVTVVGITFEGDYILLDPRRGKLRMSREKFLNEWEESFRTAVLIGTLN
jgi:ABC-type bacteriocin/lantibiotic exporter with double-glycine peptidase domain